MKKIKKTLLTQTSHRKTLKFLRKIKKLFRQRRATNLASLEKLLRSYFVTLIRMLGFQLSGPRLDLLSLFSNLFLTKENIKVFI